MDTSHRILVVNPGSTSTKTALFVDDREAQSNEVRYDPRTPQQHEELWDQYTERLHQVREWAFATTQQVSAVVSRGGLLRPVAGGTYRVNQRMLDDARANVQGEHASNLGCAIAHALAKEYGCQAYIVDPVSVDELGPLARYSGHPMISRRSLSHALNIHAAARRAASQMDVPLRSLRLLSYIWAVEFRLPRFTVDTSSTSMMLQAMARSLPNGQVGSPFSSSSPSASPARTPSGKSVHL